MSASFLCLMILKVIMEMNAHDAVDQLENTMKAETTRHAEAGNETSAPLGNSALPSGRMSGNI